MKICSKCHQDPASVYVSRSVNGVTATGVLCNQCANSLQLFRGFNDDFFDFNPFPEIDFIFSNLFSSNRACVTSGQNKLITSRAVNPAPIKQKPDIALLQKELDHAVELQDFRRAATLKKQIEQLKNL